MLGQLIGNKYLFIAMGYEGKMKVKHCFLQADMILANEAYYTSLLHGSTTAHD
jgi:hypothetical protein